MESIQYINRKTKEKISEKIAGKGLLYWLYNAPLGKATLNLLFKRKLVSALGGWFMNSQLSKRQVQKFIDQYQIDMDQYALPDTGNFSTFNEFFYRKLKSGARSVADGTVSPADGKVLAFQNMKDVESFFVKGREFSLVEFLADNNLAEKYKNGALLIVRLAPTDYHRFHFPADGVAGATKKIKGHYYSVSPLALKKSLKIFCENKREYCVLETAQYGDIAIVDVGATMVGSILQTYEPGSNIKKGDEKGYFAFGGSTIVLLFEPEKINVDTDLIENTQNGFETEVKMGERIGSV